MDNWLKQYIADEIEHRKFALKCAIEAYQKNNTLSIDLLARQYLLFIYGQPKWPYSVYPDEHEVIVENDRLKNECAHLKREVTKLKKKLEIDEQPK